MSGLTKLAGAAVLSAAATLLVLATYCNSAGASDAGTKNASSAGPTAAVNAEVAQVVSSYESIDYLTINVDVTDDGFQPPSIFIPVGREVQLVLRNRGSKEHHFRVVGFVPKDLEWLAPRENTADTGEADDAGHEGHHQASFVSFRSTSPAGVKPIGDEVHAYAAPGALDAVFFTATNTGTFLVHCPLHPEITGKVTVFGNAGRQVSVLPPSEPAPAEDPAQKSLKSAAVLRELFPLLTRTETIENRLEIEALYETPVLYELTGRAPPQSGSSGIAFTVSESVHDGELPEESSSFVMKVDSKGPFAPLQVKRLNDDPHHRITYYVFAANDSNGLPLIKGGHQILTLSMVPDGALSTSSVAALVWHLPISPSTPSSTSTLVPLNDAQIIQVDSDDKGFAPNRLTLTKGKRVVLVFRNIGSVEHHLHALTMPVKDILWLSSSQPGAPAPVDIDTLQHAPFLPYHVCDSESGLCPNGLDVHAHARAGDWLAISFIPTTPGTFSMDCSLHPNMKGTIVVR